MAFVLMGLAGALLYVLMWSKSWQELLSYASFRHVVIGALVGLIYYFAHGEHGFPNLLMCAVAGYMGPDFIEALVERIRPKPSPGRTSRMY